MAHGTCLTDDELAVLAEHGTALAHCPLSNFFFGDKPLAVRHCREMNVKASNPHADSNRRPKPPSGLVCSGILSADELGNRCGSRVHTEHADCNTDHPSELSSPTRFPPDLQVGLGTDVAGGYSPSMLSAMRTAVINSKALRMMKISAASQGSGKEASAIGVPDDVDADLIDWAEAFYLATLGSAEALGIQVRAQHRIP